MLPNGDVATSNIGEIGERRFFDAIDETIAAADDGTTLIRNNGTAGSSYLAQLTNTPGGFTSMSALTIDIRARTTGRQPMTRWPCSLRCSARTV